MTVLLLIGGLIALVVGAELLVRGASRLALALGISPLVVGLTVVAFGTSAPEMAVSVGAVLEGNADVAVGNVVGSNIFNVLFILGVSALIVPLVVHVQLIRQEVPIMIAASLLLLSLGIDGRLTIAEGVLMFALLIVYTVFLVVQSRRETREAQAEYEAEVTPAPATGWESHAVVQIGFVVVGLALLVLGARWLVDAAVAIAQALGVSDLVIGLTIVAAGTSLPEVAASVVAALKGERDIAVGNVVGSNIFNILACLGLSAVASGEGGLIVAPAVLAFDMWVMVGVAMACLPVFLVGQEITRGNGWLFLGAYVVYVLYLVLSAQQSAFLPTLQVGLLSVVVPALLVLFVFQLVRNVPAAEPPGASLEDKPETAPDLRQQPK